MPPSEARRIGLRTHLHDARSSPAGVDLRADDPAPHGGRCPTTGARRRLAAAEPGFRRLGSPRRAGHGIAVLMKIHAHCIDGQADAATSGSPTPSVSPRPSRTLAMKATPTVIRQPEAAGHPPGAEACSSSHQRRETGRDGRRNRPRPRRPCPSVDSAPSGPGTHGHIADGGGPVSGLEARPRWSAGRLGRSERAGKPSAFASAHLPEHSF
jgi:hypothetical protein